MYRRIYYDSPLSAQAVDAQSGIERLQESATISADLVGRAQRRAQRLFEARRWAQARAGFEAIANAVNDATRAKLNVGPLPRGGSGDTVSATGLGDNQTSGGSFKLIADTENWDNSIGLNNPGQSGNPDSPEYRNLFELWARGRYFPVAYSRQKVESVTQTVLQLNPARTSTQQR